MLPVLIAGGGPCGLVAATVLQNGGVPFLILEKATRPKLCSNVGAGFDLAPTAVDILKNRLGLPNTDGVLRSYSGMYLETMDGTFVRDVKMPDAMEGYGSAHRAELQNFLLDQLCKQASKAGKQESDFLKCGVAVESFQEDKDKVTVKLEDGTSVDGRALLGCDGIHSQIRRCMNEGKEDPLQYTGVTCYWGKCDVGPEYPEVNEALKKTGADDGETFVWLLGTSKQPGSFFISPGENNILWSLGIESENPPGNTTDDLTRRGGGIMTEASKTALLNSFLEKASVSTVMEKVLRGTPASGITEAGIFDRANLDLPFSSAGKRVALLGDACHPQSPYLGQGTNCAIADAFVCATKLTQMPVAEAIEFYDWDERRVGINKLIVEARSQGKSLNGADPFTCWILRMIMKYASMSGRGDEMKKYDNSNRDMVLRLDGKLEEKKSCGMKALAIVLSMLGAAGCRCVQ